MSDVGESSPGWAPILAARKWGSSIWCREYWAPVGCHESLLVGRPKLFLSAKPIGPTRPTTEYWALVGGFMGPLGQITALCPLISRSWWPVGPVRQLHELSHCRQLGSSWSGPQPHCSSIGRQGSPVPTRWAHHWVSVWALPDRSPQIT